MDSFGSKTEEVVSETSVRGVVPVPVTLLDRPGQLDAVGDADLAEDVAEVGLDGLLAEEELGRDLGVRLAVDDEARQLELALGQRRDAAWRRPDGTAAIDRAAELSQLTFHLGLPSRRPEAGERRGGTLE